MLGFIIGTICLIALIKVARRGRRGACGSGGCGGGGRGWRGRRGWRGGDEGGGRGWMRWVYEALDASPSQETVLRSAIEDVRRASEGARREWAQARSALAEAVSGDTFDETSVQKAYARLEVEGQHIRDRFVENLRQVHETLTPAQRKRLASLMSRGVGGFDPYRA
jgi:Spy/CpxP family protein refolding chaperone